LNQFLSFLSEVGISHPGYRQFDLSYVNHIAPSNGLDKFRFDELLVDHAPKNDKTRFLPEPDGINWSTSYSMPNGAGRLHVISQLSNNASNKDRILRLDLIARGISSEQTEDDRRSWFDVAHEWITHGFADVTLPAAQYEIWGRTS
jgi:hypothetical protein